MLCNLGKKYHYYLKETLGQNPHLLEHSVIKIFVSTKVTGLKQIEMIYNILIDLYILPKNVWTIKIF